MLEEHLLRSSWAAAKCLKKGGGLAHKDDSERHPYSPRPGQSVGMCLSVMEEPPLVLLLRLRSPSQRQSSSAQDVLWWHSCKGSLDGWMDVDEASINLVVAQSWQLRLGESGFISAAGKACNHPFSF